MENNHNNKESMHETVAIHTCLHSIIYSTYSAFTLATLEPSQTTLILFLKFDINGVASTWEVPVVVLLSTFKNKNSPVWHSSEVTSVNALLDYRSASIFTIIIASFYACSYKFQCMTTSLHAALMMVE